MHKLPLSRIALLGILLLSVLYFAITRQPIVNQIPEGISGAQVTTGETQETIAPGLKIDDWQFKPESSSSDGYRKSSYGMTAPSGAIAPRMAMMEAAAPTGAGNIGFSVGGAKDINNFRENIKNGYLPLPTDITYEGLFYDYFFDTGATQPCDKLFCPSYSYALTADPFSDKDEYYLTVGLNSGIKESDFKRKKLNLVVVLDISGSMGSPFDQYYYDRFGNRQEPVDSESESARKIEVASKSVNALLDHLNDDDRFGMVVFDDYAELAKPLGLVGNTDMEKIKKHILDLNERGSTNLSAGMDLATKQFRELENVNQNEYENRIIFLTDAQPNRGDTSDEGMLDTLEDNADSNIYTTFIGIGVDFNTELIELITKIRGANYYSVHTSREFKERMDEGFDYMVTPLVFDLKLKLEADGWKIDQVYGSPEADAATGQLMYINTLFPSKTEGGQTKGGVVLIKLSKISEGGSLKLSVSYEDRLGKKDRSESTIAFPAGTSEYFANTGIRKAVLLTRYANLLKDWLIDARINEQPRPIPMADYRMPPQPCLLVTREYGIVVPDKHFMPPCWPHPWPVLGEWERQSMELNVDREYRSLFSDFARYFETEMDELNDKDLEQELDILKELKA